MTGTRPQSTMRVSSVSQVYTVSRFGSDISAASIYPPHSVRRTQRIAKNTSVTLNRFSTVHVSPRGPVPSLRSSSPKNVKAQRRPHHAAGAVLRARHINRGICHRELTPKRTATRGWDPLDCVVASIFTSGEEKLAA